MQISFFIGVLMAILFFLSKNDWSSKKIIICREIEISQYKCNQPTYKSCRKWEVYLYSMYKDKPTSIIAINVVENTRRS